MPTRRVSTSRPLPGMSKAEWDQVRVTKTAAELTAMGCMIEETVPCCAGDGTGCSTHDPDLVSVRAIREKSIKGALTAQDITDHNTAEIRLKAKGLL